MQKILDGLMTRYKDRVPNVQAIIDCMIAGKIIAGENDIENDHIAFRTMGVPHLGMASLEKIFLHYGYTKKDHYYFEQKKLDACWYAPPEPGWPRIFLSELRVKDLPADIQSIIYKYTGQLETDPVDVLDLDDSAQVDLFLHSSLWGLPSYADYQQLAAVSEYAAWVIYNRYYLNHFTISIHHLQQPYHTIEAFNAFLESHGFLLNDAGGKIKTSADGYLRQSATVAAMVEAVFSDGIKAMIPGSYIEFAERKIMDGGTSRRDGFETSNADKIFESTYAGQTGRLG